MTNLCGKLLSCYYFKNNRTIIKNLACILVIIKRIVIALNLPQSDKPFIIQNIYMKKIYSLLLLLCAFSARSQVVINEVYGGGGNSGATYKNDFIELYNNSLSAVNLTG